MPWLRSDAVPVIDFPITNLSAVEATGQASVYIRRSGILDATASATLASSNGSATAPADFAAISRVISFIPSATNATTTISIVTPDAIEFNEQFALALNPIAPTMAGSASRATMIIRDGDNPNDVNGDNVVNAIDLALVASKFGTSAGNPDWNPAADANGDGIVNDADYVVVSANFGKTYP